MLETGYGFVAVILLAALFVVANQGAWAASPYGGTATRIYEMAGSSNTGGDSQPAKSGASASASASARSSGSASGQGTCSAESSSEAEVRINGKVVRRSAHKRASQSGNGCTAHSESSAEASTNPPDQSEPRTPPQQ